MSIRGLSCTFPVPDIKKTEEYYVNCLGFKAVEYLNCTEAHVCLYLDDIEIILLKTNNNVQPNRALYGYGYDAYLYTDDQEVLEKQFFENDVKIIKSINTTDYQNKEIVIEDIDGRWLAFGAKQ